MERPDNTGRPTNLNGHADLIFLVVASRQRDSSACGTGPLASMVLPLNEKGRHMIVPQHKKLPLSTDIFIRKKTPITETFFFFYVSSF